MIVHSTYIYNCMNTQNIHLAIVASGTSLTRINFRYVDVAYIYLTYFCHDLKKHGR